MANAKPAAAAQHRQLGIEQERRRLARELHDETLQNLAAVAWTLGAARRARDGDGVHAAVNEAILQVRQEIANLRRLIADLRPVALAGAGLEAAIRDLAERAERYGLEVSVVVLVDERDRTGDTARLELETATYRIVQEALTNARKHGKASRALVDVRQRGQSIQITVQDDGEGCDPTTLQAGLGLLGMRERVELFDGTLRLESAPGGGTTVQAVVFRPDQARRAERGQRRAEGAQKAPARALHSPADPLQTHLQP